MADILDEIADAVATRNTAAAKAAADLTKAQSDLAAAQAKVAELTAALAACQAQQPSGGSGATITTDVPTGWKVAVTQNFDSPCAEGQFAVTYPHATSRIGFYPRGYYDTRWKQNRVNGQAIRGGEYSADFISVANSICTQRMFVRNNVLQCSALVPIAIPTGGKWGDSPGMIYEHRSRFLYTDGIKSAHLLWPLVGTNTTGATGGGGNGEIDFPEFQASELVDCFVHHQNATVGSDQKLIETTANPREWHTYRLMWKMGQSVTIWIDGVQIGQPYTTRIPATPMHCVLQNESWLDGRAIPADAQGTHEMDWVRILIPA